MNKPKKRILSFCLSIVFVLAAFAVPLTTGAEEKGHFCFELPNDCFHCADHDAADVCDESTEIRYVPPIIDPDCGCSTANAGTYTTNTNSGNVNIRAGHSTNTAIIGQIPRGAYFAVEFASAAWAHVTYGGKSGYVSMSVIKKDSGNSNPSCGCSTANAGTYTTNTNGGDVRIRAGHGTNTDVIGKIPYGSSFSVSRASSAWAHVTYDGKSGYVSMSVIKKLPPTPTNGIVLDNNNATVLNTNATTTLRVKSYFPSTDTLKWTSSNSRVASINQTTGKVTAHACGKVAITVSLVEHPSVSASMVLTVNPPTTPTSGVDSDCVYMIKNTNNDKYLAATGSGVKLADKNDMDGRQLWYAKWTGSGYKLYSMGHKDTASAGQYESLLRGSTKYTTPGFGNEYAADLTWSIHRYNVYYWYITNTSDKYRNTSLSANASNDTVSCIPLADETTYARWEFEKIETPTFNNYWTGGYIGHQSGTIHIKINLDESLFSYNGQSTGITRELFDVLNRSSNPWNNLSSRIIIYGPKDNNAPNNAFQITYKGDATLDKGTVGETYGRDNADNDLSLGANWNKVCILLNTSGRWKSLNDIHKEKTILHELGHALKLAHPFHSEDTADVPNGRPSYPDNVYGCYDVCAIMNWQSPTVNSNLTCRYPKKHDIINLKNKWGW